MSSTSSQSIKNWAAAERPREKLLLHGPGQLSDAELLAILLGSGNRRQSAVELSKTILQHFGSNLSQLARATRKDLEDFSGVGTAKAVSILAAMELARRKSLSRLPEQFQICSSQDAFECIGPILGDLPHEEFWVVLLNRANRVMQKVRISQGGVAGTVVDAKIIFKEALAHLASGIILCHNHPSGNLRPSQADIDITQKISKAGKTLDIRVLDHLIVSVNGYYSFADEGMME